MNLSRWHLLLLVLSVLFCSFQEIPGSSGRIFVYFNVHYYKIQEDGKFEKIIVPMGVGNTQEFLTLYHERETTRVHARVCVQQFLQQWQTKMALPPAGFVNYSADPTGRHVLWLGEGIGYDYIKKVFNVSTADSFHVVSSDYAFNFGMLRYAWSHDGQWLAFGKEVKGSKEPHANTVSLVRLSTQAVEDNILLDPDEGIEEITWDPSSSKLAVLTCEWLRARTISNLVIPWAWFHPAMVNSYYVYVLEPGKGVVSKVEIADRVDYQMTQGVFWVK